MNMRKKFLAALLILDTISAAQAAPEWVFNTPDSFQGWKPNPELVDGAVKDGAFTALATGNDPSLTSPSLQVKAGGVPVVTVRMKLQNAGGAGSCNPGPVELFWRTGAKPDYTPAAKCRVEGTGDGEWHDYAFEVGKNENWTDTITGIRLDPCRTPGVKVSIGSVRFQEGSAVATGPGGGGTAGEQKAGGGASFADDFSKVTTAWRYGNVTVRPNGGALELTGERPQVTLSTTAVHPENLSEFSATLHFDFQKDGNRELWIGWGKPMEWDSQSAYREKLRISPDGKVQFFANGAKVGEGRVTVGGDGKGVISFSRRDGQLTLYGEDQKPVSVWPLPEQDGTLSGCLGIWAAGFGARSSPVRLTRFEISTGGRRPPLNEEQRMEGFQDWARGVLAKNDRQLQTFAGYFAAEAAAGRWGTNTTLAVTPGLVNAGEKVTLHFTCKGAVPSPCEAKLEENYFQGGPSRPLPLKWTEKDGVNRADIEIKPGICGNSRVIWKVGDEELSRVFGVIEPGYTVCRFMITADLAMDKEKAPPAAFDAIHDAGLPLDYWDREPSHYSPFAASPEYLKNLFRKRLQFSHRWGDYFMPLFNADWLLPDCLDRNLWRLSADVQNRGLKQALRLWEILGLDKLDVISSYTLNTDTVHAAAANGVKGVDSLCNWQNWCDGGSDNHWQINHCGTPALPCFLADDDFRKISPGQGVISFTQSTASDVRTYSIMGCEADPTLVMLRQRERFNNMAATVNGDRFQAVFDLWLAESACQSEPLFLSIGLQNFIFLPDWNQANRNAIHYVCEQARTKKLVFAQAGAIADYYLQHYPHQPENWFYWPDCYAGVQSEYKPEQVPDRIEVSNAKFHSVHREGEVLPYFFWDYTKPWKEKAWDTGNLRQYFGLIRPDLINADTFTPQMGDLRAVKTTAAMQPDKKGVEFKIEVDTPEDLAVLPLGLWHIPLAAGSCKAEPLPEGLRFVKIVDGSTGNLHGILVCENVTKGKHSWTVRIDGKAEPVRNASFAIGKEIRGRFFQRSTGPVAYVWRAAPGQDAGKVVITPAWYMENAKTPSPIRVGDTKLWFPWEDPSKPTGVLKIQVPEGRTASVHYNNGKVEQAENGILNVRFDPVWYCESPMISGLNEEEIQAGAEFVQDPRGSRQDQSHQTTGEQTATLSK